MSISKIKVLIADDHPVVRTGLTAMLQTQAEFEVVGTARNGLEAVAKARELKPDIILMDLRMPELDGVEAMRRIRAEDTRIQFVILTTYDDDQYVVSGIQAGARAYMLKDSPPAEIFRAISSVYAGKSVIEPELVSTLFNHFSEPAEAASTAGNLSEREMKVLQLMASGAPNKIIAVELSITENTVKSHVHSILYKLGVGSRTEAVAHAISSGMVDI